MGRISEYINGHRGRSTYLNSSSRHGSSGGGGMGVEFSVNSGAIELQVKQIESMMTDHPELRKKLQDAIREDVWKARNTVVSNMTGVFANGDPAEARRAVRNIVYEKILGANLNILEMKKGTAQWKVRQIDRKVEQNPKMWGGNRIKRSFKTTRMHGYEGKARGMILRWVNSGMTKTSERVTRYGNRGSIAARHFFEPLASAALNVVSQHLAQIIEQEIANAFNDNENNS
jgi:hypothetical protein